MSKSLFCCGVALLFPLAPATAQSLSTAQAADAADAVDDQAARTDDSSETIIITGARTRLPATALPLTYDVLGGEDFRQQVAVSGSVIDAVSARLPAFSPTREKLSGAGESLRGRSPLYAINGVPQSTPIRDGSRDGYTIDPFFIDRVEVIYGSNALQGIGATGGVVNQVTLQAPHGDGLALQSLVQSTGGHGFDGDSLGGKTAGALSWRGGAFDFTTGLAFERRGAFVDGHGERIGVDGTQGEIQDSDSWSLFGRFGFQLSPSARLELVANRFALEGNGHYVLVAGNRAAGIPATSVRGEPQGELPSNRAELLSLSFTDEALGGGNLTAQAFFSRTRDIFGGGVFGTFQDPTIAPLNTLFDQSVNRSRKLGGKFSYERGVPGLEALTVTAGLDLLFDRTAQTLLHTGREWVPQSDFRSIAPFLQGNLKLLDGKLRLAGGARYETVRLKVGDFITLARNGAENPADPDSYNSIAVAGGSPSFRKLLWNGGVVAEPVRGLRAYASYAEGYTIADVGRILRAVSEEGVDVDNYLALEPVISNNRELGIEWKRGALQAGASYFWSDSDLGSLLERNADGIFDVIRAPIAIEGLELSADWRTPLDGVRIGAAYVHLKGRTDCDEDGSLDCDLDGANISPDRLNLYAAFESGRFDARLAMRNYFKREFDDAGNDFGGYTLFDAGLGYRFGRKRVALSLQNLTDEFYIGYHGQTVGTNNTYFAGRGRTVTLGVTSSF